VKSMTGEKVIVGVDTHKHIHVAVALSWAGERLGDLTVAADPGGYEQLLDWAQAFGVVWCFGVEGCGSYGQGLVGALRRHDQRVVEAGRPDRRDRRERGKSDPIDAENAARAVLAGTATGVPKTADGTSEVIREIKIARDTAVKSRTQAVITLKTLIVTAQMSSVTSSSRSRKRRSGTAAPLCDPGRSTPLSPRPSTRSAHSLAAGNTSRRRSRSTTGSWTRSRHRPPPHSERPSE
jgi:transposase